MNRSTGAEVRILGFALGFSVLLLLAHYAVMQGATTMGSRYIYGAIDRHGFLVLVFLCGFLGTVAWLLPEKFLDSMTRIPLRALRPRKLALCVLVLTAAGTRFVHHEFAFTMDEFMTRFQGEIFEASRLTGQFPPEWRAYGRALMPVYAYFDPATGLVASSYRPGMALLYAAFDLVELGPYTGAFLAAGSVILTAAVARLLWPGREDAAVVAALLVATSQQVLALAMTSYAMPAHLFFNMLWLWLFLRDKRASHAVAPFVGVFTAALHQVHIHALFALPFLLTLLRPLRPGLIAYYGTLYLTGHLLILNWGALVMPDAGSVRSGGPPADLGSADAFLAFIGRIAHVPDIEALGSVFVNLVRFLAWQSLALVPLLLVLRRRATWSPMLATLAASVVISFAPYPFMVPDPQHGWGYRYLHGVIGNVALLGAAGWTTLNAKRPDLGKYRALVLCLLVLTPPLLIPMRAVQIERVVGAYARATAFVERQPADVVVVDPYLIFYGRDLRRNDPFLRNSPIVLTLDEVPKARLDALCEAYSVAFVSAAETGRFGVPVADLEQATWLPADYRRWRTRLTAPDCTAAGHRRWPAGIGRPGKADMNDSRGSGPTLDPLHHAP